MIRWIRRNPLWAASGECRAEWERKRLRGDHQPHVMIHRNGG